MNDSVAAIQAALEHSTTGEWLSPLTTSVLGTGITSAPSGNVIALGITTRDDAIFTATAHNHWSDVLEYIRELEAQLGEVNG